MRRALDEIKMQSFLDERASEKFENWVGDAAIWSVPSHENVRMWLPDTREANALKLCLGMIEQGRQAAFCIISSLTRLATRTKGSQASILKIVCDMMDSEHFKKWTIFILSFAGNLLAEVKQVFYSGIFKFLYNNQNIFNFAILSMYLASYTLRIITEKWVREANIYFNGTARAWHYLNTGNYSAFDDHMAFIRSSESNLKYFMEGCKIFICTNFG